MTLREQIATYDGTKRRGIEFLLQQIDSEGRLADSDRPRVTFYRLPWSLAVGGETGTAMRVLDWIERTRLGADGQFRPAGAWDPVPNRTTNTYAETILAYGAWLLRRFDVANRVMDYAVPYQDPETGGIFMTKEETGPSGRQLLFPTCQFGMSAALTGRTHEARMVGGWLERLWAAQPELPNRLFTMWTRDGGLETEIPAGEDARHYVNESQQERQLHYNGGIAAACLTHIFMTTGEAKWLDLARKYQRFSMDSTPDQFKTKQVCKSAWGSGLITLASGENCYRDWMIKMGDWFTAEQDPDGGWSNTKYIEEHPPLAHRIEATAEFVVHVDTLIAALSAVDARTSGEVA